MKNQNERGFTLVEIMGVVVILGIVTTFLLNILISSNDTNTKQLSTNQQLDEMSYVLKVITKDMRRTTQFKTPPYIFENDDASIQYVYVLDGNGNITRNGEIIASNIEEFNIKSVVSNRLKGVSIEIKIKNGRSNETELTFRNE